MFSRAQWLASHADTHIHRMVCVCSGKPVNISNSRRNFHHSSWRTFRNVILVLGATRERCKLFQATLPKVKSLVFSSLSRTALFLSHSLAPSLISPTHIHRIHTYTSMKKSLPFLPARYVSEAHGTLCACVECCV